jgi:fumarate reductase iron-sulfur subunit
MSGPGSELTVSLWRGGEKGRYETYKVPLRENQTVLDVVTFVQRHLDPTLSYRFACRVGMCGSCAMTVNGRPRWTCRTHPRPTRDRAAREPARDQGFDH